MIILELQLEGKKHGSQLSSDSYAATAHAPKRDCTPNIQTLNFKFCLACKRTYNVFAKVINQYFYINPCVQDKGGSCSPPELPPPPLPHTLRYATY